MGSEGRLFPFLFHNLKCTSYFEDFFKIALAGKEHLVSFCFYLFSVTCSALGHSATVPPHMPLKSCTRGPMLKNLLPFSTQLLSDAGFSACNTAVGAPAHQFRGHGSNPAGCCDFFPCQLNIILIQRPS